MKLFFSEYHFSLFYCQYDLFIVDFPSNLSEFVFNEKAQLHVC